MVKLKKIKLSNQIDCELKEREMYMLRGGNGDDLKVCSCYDMPAEMDRMLYVWPLIDQQINKNKFKKTGKKNRKGNSRYQSEWL